MPERPTPDTILPDPPEQSAESSEAVEQSSAGNGDAKRQPRTFGRRLAIAFALVAAVTALLAGVLISATWSYQFNRYVQENLQHGADYIAASVAQSYAQFGGFTVQTLVSIPRAAEGADIGVQIVDPKGSIVYDQATFREHMTSLMQNGASVQMPQTDSNGIVLQPKGKIITSPIVVNHKLVGTVKVWSYGGGTSFLSESDNQFRRGSFIGLALAALVAIAFSGIAGSFYARRMVKPIERITETAKALQGGDHDARTGLAATDEIGFLGTTFDAMADSIEADREMERRLTADVAHELRTPLQAIQATVEAMQDGVLPADEERLGIVRDETRRLSRLTDGILELTRLERGTTAFDMRRIDAAGPVRTAVDAIEALIETCELTLTADIADHLLIRGDRDRLQQAIGNLLSNAARYTPAGGRVEVRLRRESNEAVISIADTGVGIADEDMARVFARFWRADNARAATTGGSGIGLAVTKEIVERHGGSISAAHRVDGEGSVFTIRLPLA